MIAVKYFIYLLFVRKFFIFASKNKEFFEKQQKPINHS